MTVKAIYFSPTHTTKNILKEIFARLAGAGTFYDVTTPRGREIPLVLSSNDLLLIGGPVYSGRLPGIFADYLRRQDFTGMKIAGVVVYGNRACEDALIELKDIIVSRGGILIAAGAFIGEHSYTESVAYGRPDDQDLEKAGVFAEAIEGNISRETSVMVPGDHPYRDIRFSHPMGPHTADTCVQCHLCAETCPAGAIDFLDSRIADFDKCLHCHRCVYSCPVKAKVFDQGMVPIVRWLVANCTQKRLEPRFFLE